MGYKILTENTILSVENLRTYFNVGKRVVKAVDGVSFKVKENRILGVVGESGCGKSVMSLSILKLLARNGEIKEGTIQFELKNKSVIFLDKLNPQSIDMRKIRGNEISMIFQDPMVSLNPVHRIGNQIVENIIYHKKISRKEAKSEAVELLEKMNIPKAEERYNDYPFQFSGGMIQRTMIAIALSCNPKLLIADEPTTALDVTIQLQIMELIKNVQKQYEMSIMWITHDMGVIAELADEVMVMYMGKIAEIGTINNIFGKPSHPYTQKLLESMPILGLGKNQKLKTIGGSVPDPFNLPQGCKFEPRCGKAMDICKNEPNFFEIEKEHKVSCWLYS